MYIQFVQAQSSCGNFVTNSQASYTKNVAGVALAPNAIAFPCGTIGRAYNKLKDEIKGFRILNPSANMEFSIVKTGIAWPSDIGRHKNYDLSLQPFSVTEEEWLVWFRPAAQSTFYKLNGIIQADMPAGTYTVKFLNRTLFPM